MSNLRDPVISTQINLTVDSKHLVQNVRYDEQSFRTIYYQGMGSSQTQIGKYIGSKTIIASTGEKLSCVGKNNLKPIDVLINPFIGKEIQDVNLSPAFYNPIHLVSCAISKISNKKNGIRVGPVDSKHSIDKGSIKYHAIHLSKMSISQKTDIESHKTKYDCWLNSPDKNKNEKLILYGVSRGSATTFNAFVTYKYPEVALVVLEGCFFSVDDVINNRFNPLSRKIIKSAISSFTKHELNGISPGSKISEFPENVPVVFITSEIDKEVPCSTTIKLAKALANKGKNDVYLLKLKKSSHPNYMFDHLYDRNQYEFFMHALYKKYGMPYNPRLAKNGKNLVEKNRLIPNEDQSIELQDLKVNVNSPACP